MIVSHFDGACYPERQNTIILKKPKMISKRYSGICSRVCFIPGVVVFTLGGLVESNGQKNLLNKLWDNFPSGGFILVEKCIFE